MDAGRTLDDTYPASKKVTNQLLDIINLVKSNRDKHFCICSHDNPDPDSLSSCMGMEMLVRLLGATQIDMVYHGEIDDLQNRSMHTILNMTITPWNEDLQKKYDKLGDDAIFIFVDCMPGNKNMSVSYAPSLVVDHHKRTISDEDFIFVHEEAGACATIITDLIISIPQEVTMEDPEDVLSSDNDEFKTVSTALAVGIKIDTRDFLNDSTTKHDFNAYHFLTKFFSEEKFSKIINYQLPPYFFEYRNVAWNNKVLSPPYLLLGAGLMQESHGNCLARIADEHLRIEGVETVITYGLLPTMGRACIRTNSTSISADALIKDIFGGRNGGAKNGGVGGARWSLSPLLSDLPQEDRVPLWEIHKSVIERQFELATQK